MNMKLLTTGLMWLVALMASANDGVFFVNGNQIVPVHETDVAVTKEVLTISICDDGFASVDVLYEFTNRGNAKVVDMGFEAQAPYNSGENLLGKKGHPNIQNFTVTMNGQSLTYSTCLVRAGSEETSTDLSQFQSWQKRCPPHLPLPNVCRRLQHFRGSLLASACHALGQSSD